MRASVVALETMAEKIDDAYGLQAREFKIMNVESRNGDLRTIKAFASGQISDE